MGTGILFHAALEEPPGECQTMDKHFKSAIQLEHSLHFAKHETFCSIVHYSCNCNEFITCQLETEK